MKKYKCSKIDEWRYGITYFFQGSPLLNFDEQVTALSNALNQNKEKAELKHESKYLYCRATKQNKKDDEKEKKILEEIIRKHNNSSHKINIQDCC